MISLKLLTCSFLAIFACAGCGRSDVQARLDYTLRMAREAASGHTQSPPFVRTQDAALVAALAAVKAADLHDAKLVSAAYMENPREVRLRVVWLQEQPTPDSVELISSSGEKSILLPIDPVYQEENRKAAKDSVQYQTGFLWKKPSVMASQLESPEKRSHWAVRLLRQGQVCSETVGLIW